MNHCELSQSERQRRHQIAEHTRKMILSQLPVEDQDETSLMADYRDYYLQISFSDLHPLMVLCLAKAAQETQYAETAPADNELNLRSILGSHAINDEVGCYSYGQPSGWIRSWTHPDSSRFLTGASMRRTAATEN